ncbi:glycosyltransferase family 2 protein [Candidatus Obscuribacterales bacterium]|nr:glycosyltransferase family 2 protein [Candidatus Obscuribacterales bacterium]
MLVIAVFLVSVTVLVAFVQSLAFARLVRYVEAELARQPGQQLPKASVILPCKGLDPAFRENVEKLLNQDYPDFEVIFAVAQESDPAYAHLVELASQSPKPAKVIVAGVAAQRAQKINNQLHALEQIRSDSDVLVFVDSDVIARPDFLSRLVEPLTEDGVGVTTGYRFYIASPTNCAAILRSLWNRVTAWEMANPKFAFAWGGAMAIRKSVFTEAGVRDAWDKAADDDLSLTTSVKKLGLTVRFVPQCLVASDGDAPFGEIMEWTNRQLILTKVYYPELWKRAIARASFMLVWLVLMLIATGSWLVTQEPAGLIAIAAGFTIVPVEVFFLLKARKLWQKILLDHSDHLTESLLASCMAIPLAHAVLPFMTLASLLTNRIQWRGVTYELKSPTETLVIG